jgi:hypothetical protein
MRVKYKIMENSNDLIVQQTCPHLSQQTVDQAVVPDITSPLVSTTNQPPVIGTANLGLLNSFIGTWNSPTGSDATGYNVMPLPQVEAPNGQGYITKNFPYFEEITFSPIAGGAPNRRGQITQSSGVLFYEQRVYIANNTDPNGTQPIQNTLIHAENGTWLYHTLQNQIEGAFGPRFVPGLNPLPVQNPATQYNKQVSVPHGNSILMVGGLGISGKGMPVFPVTDRSLPPFTGSTVIDPVSVLKTQLTGLANKGITVTSYMSISVSTDPAVGGGVSNINFENANSKVVSMDTTWYLETLSNGVLQLQYVQNIVLEFLINGIPVQFSHIDANTLQLVETFAQVNAKNSWMNTGITVQSGVPLTISYKSGKWTANPKTNNGNLYDANGCPGNIATKPTYPLKGVNKGALVGQIGVNPVFLVGDGPVITPAGQSGALKLCINDALDGLTDNSGSLLVSIKF